MWRAAAWNFVENNAEKEVKKKSEWRRTDGNAMQIKVEEKNFPRKYFYKVTHFWDTCSIPFASTDVRRRNVSLDDDLHLVPETFHMYIFGQMQWAYMENIGPSMEQNRKRKTEEEEKEASVLRTHYKKREHMHI